MTALSSAPASIIQHRLTAGAIRSRGRRPAVVVALGALGVVTGLELTLVPAFTVRQWVYENLPRGELDACSRRPVSHLPITFRPSETIQMP